MASIEIIVQSKELTSNNQDIFTDTIVNYLAGRFLPLNSFKVMSAFIDSFLVITLQGIPYLHSGEISSDINFTILNELQKEPINQDYSFFSRVKK